MHINTNALVVVGMLATSGAVTAQCFRPPYRVEGLGHAGVSQTFAIEDRNRDGLLDMLLLSPSRLGVRPLTALGGFRYAEASTVLLGGQNQIAGDLNHDGKLDVVGVARSSALWWLISTPDGGFAERGGVAAPHAYGFGVIADFNGDGHNDVACPYHGGYALLWGDGTGNLSAPVRTASAEMKSVSVFRTGDLNNDGLADVVASMVGEGNGLRIGYNTGAGVFSFVQYSVAETGDAQPYDLDGDGLLDIVHFPRNYRQVDILRQGPAGVFTPAESLVTLENITYCFTIADMNDDDRPDLVVGRRAPASLHVFPQQADGRYGPHLSVPTGLNSAVASLATGDFDADGDVDIILADPTSTSDHDFVVIESGTPEILSQPEDQIVREGRTITLEVELVGSDGDFRWTKDGVLLHDTNRIQGSFGRRMQIYGAVAADAGRYRPVLSSCGPELREVLVNVSCAADFTRDGFLDFFDYDAFVVAFVAGETDADFNGDGMVDGFDYAAFLETYESGC